MHRESQKWASVSGSFTFLFFPPSIRILLRFSARGLTQIWGNVVTWIWDEWSSVLAQEPGVKVVWSPSIWCWVCHQFDVWYAINLMFGMTSIWCWSIRRLQTMQSLIGKCPFYDWYHKIYEEIECMIPLVIDTVYN